MLFTTSWDDGYALDRKVADLLKHYGCKGTFYVCPLNQHERKMLGEQGIKELGETFEIGSHTTHHPHLTRLPSEEAAREIRESKAWVEQITGKPCRSFCFPYGDVNAAVRGLVEAAGYIGARTTEDLRFSATDPLLLPVTLQVFPFPWRRKFRPRWKLLDPLGPLRARWKRLSAIGIPVRERGSWLSLAKALFAHAAETGQPFFHLYGHSHEIERDGMWGELETFLRFIAEEGKEITHVSNGELAAELRNHFV